MLIALRFICIIQGVEGFNTIEKSSGFTLRFSNSVEISNAVHNLYIHVHVAIIQDVGS